MSTHGPENSMPAIVKYTGSSSLMIDLRLVRDRWYEDGKGRPESVAGDEEDRILIVTISTDNYVKL